MKLVLFIGGTSAPLVYFANKIHEHHEVSLLVVENTKMSPPPPSSSTEANQVGFLHKVVNYLKFRLDSKLQANKKRLQAKEDGHYYQQIFKGLHQSLDESIPTLYVEDINSEETAQGVKQVKPDLIIDHGTSLVKSHIIDLAPLALNLHWGLSPYYRGVMCTHQALLNWDTQNIGVTIHKLAKKIDGGDVLGQSRLEIKATDNINRITSRLSLQGTEILIRVIKHVNEGKELSFDQQDFNQGFLIKGKSWNEHTSAFIRELDEHTLTKMIKSPSRGPAPIVKFPK